MAGPSLSVQPEVAVVASLAGVGIASYVGASYVAITWAMEDMGPEYFPLNDLRQEWSTEFPLEEQEIIWYSTPLNDTVQIGTPPLTGEEPSIDILADPANPSVELPNISTASTWNWKSVPQFGHTFLRHGKGKKNTNKLTGRAANTGETQGQWLDNQRVAEFLGSFIGTLTEVTDVDIIYLLD